MDKRGHVAVVLAGGAGTRFGGGLPKQFLRISGRTILEHSLNAFQNAPDIDEIAVVSHADFMAETEKIVKDCRATKVARIVAGGKERSDSSLSAIKAYEGRTVNLIFHDAARPLVSQRIIADVCRALETHKAVAVAVPASDTILETQGDFIFGIPDRSRLQRAQTPQAFAVEVIAEAYRIALQDKDFKVSDDCGVVLKYLPQEPIFLVRGDTRNIKITYPEDILYADLLFQKN